jgi:hypothetical protein
LRAFASLLRRGQYCATNSDSDFAYCSQYHLRVGAATSRIARSSVHQLVVLHVHVGCRLDHTTFRAFAAPRHAAKDQLNVMDPNWALVILTAVLIIVTGYYAVQNKRLVDEMRKENAIALYDRRAAIFRAVSKLTATLLSTADLPFEVINQFAIDVGGAPYLLNSADASIVSDIIKRTSVISTRADTLRRMPNGPDKVAMLDRQQADCQWLETQERTLKEGSAKYLKIS